MDGAPTEKAVAKFLAYFEAIKAAHVPATGRSLEMNKSTEPDCLRGVFDALWRSEETGVAFLAEMVDRLVWGQCLGNGNHRTTTLFTQSFVDYVGGCFPTATVHDFPKELDVWIDRSQALIRRRGEPGYAQARLAPRHKEITTQWVSEMVDGQSPALAMIGAQRLMNFISASERSG